MGFLSPLFLALGLGAAIPLLIHLLRRRTGVRIDFPAVRYLARAEQEHSRRLRLRNLLLMLLRVSAVACLAMAAARPVSDLLGRLVGASHAPAAIGIVLDNSLSTSVVVGGRPVLETLKDAAQRVVQGTSLGDHLWVITADGRTVGGTAATVGSAIARVQPLGGAGDLVRAVGRATALVRSTGVADPVVAIATDAQATAWSTLNDLGGLRGVTYQPAGAAPFNRALVAASARPTRWTPRGEISALVIGAKDSSSADSTTYRIGLGGRTLARGTVVVARGAAAANDRGATDARGSAAGAISVHAAPPERGWVAGSVEIEPDELRGDDIRYFALWIGEAPALRADSSAGPFARSAIDALVTSARASPSRSGGISVVAADRLSGLPALIIAPLDPVRTGAANRALERAGVPWRFGAADRGEAAIDNLEPAADETPSADSAGAPAQATATLRYALVPQPGAVADTLARAGGRPWAVAGPGYVLLASPLEPTATSFPLRAAFVPWIGDVAAQRLAPLSAGVGGKGGGVIGAGPGAVVRRPPGVDELEATDGSTRVLSGAMIDVPAKPGVYFLRRGAIRVGAVVVNPEPRESNLERLTPHALETRFKGRGVRAFTDPDRWARSVFDAHSDRPLGALFLMLALVLLLVEGALTRGVGKVRAVGVTATRRAA